MLRAVGLWVSRVCAGEPRTNVYGLARSMMAAATLLTLLATPYDLLFSEPSGYSALRSAHRYTFFSALSGHPDIAKSCATIALITVCSGWRPRWTAIPHWFICFSLQLDGRTIDGGDQVASALTLLMIPICLLDSRKWHWSRPDPQRLQNVWEYLKMFLLNTCRILIRIQVSGVYLDAAIGKMAHREWSDGTAMYYWMEDGVFGAARWSRWLILPLMRLPAIVSTLTWSVIIVELGLAAALVMPKSKWPFMLAIGLILHAGIFAIQGLASFATVMGAALILYLTPASLHLSLSSILHVRHTPNRSVEGQQHALT